MGKREEVEDNGDGIADMKSQLLHLKKRTVKVQNKVKKENKGISWAC